MTLCDSIIQELPSTTLFLCEAFGNVQIEDDKEGMLLIQMLLREKITWNGVKARV